MVYPLKRFKRVTQSRLSPLFSLCLSEFVTSGLPVSDFRRSKRLDTSFQRSLRKTSSTTSRPSSKGASTSYASRIYLCLSDGRCASCFRFRGIFPVRFNSLARFNFLVSRLRYVSVLNNDYRSWNDPSATRVAFSQVSFVSFAPILQFGLC